MCLWLELPLGFDASELLIHVKERGVLFAPGRYFYVQAPLPNTLRLGFDSQDEQQIAREMNLSETVFVLQSDKEDVLRRLRIFTPSSELPFAGHPIVGTWNCLAREGVVSPPENGDGWVQIKHEVGIGILPVDIEFKNGEPARVVMTQGKFEIRAEIDDWHEQAEIAHEWRTH